jgi:protein TonB
MTVGFSPDEQAERGASYFARWLHEPIAQGLLFSLALHLAIAVIFQPASGASGRHTVVINARLQPAASPAEQVPESTEVPTEAETEPEAGPPIALLTATTPSPVPPIPQAIAPARDPSPTPNTPATPIPSPAPVSAPVTSAASPADAASSPAQPAEKLRGGAQSTGLPIGIDTTWYVARQVDHHPKVIGVIEPAYPEEAKRRNIEGSLKLMLKIDDLGRVQSAEVVEATPPGVFDDAALAAFRDARFRPAMKDGRPVRYQAYMRVEFKLKD